MGLKWKAGTKRDFIDKGKIFLDLEKKNHILKFG